MNAAVSADRHHREACDSLIGSEEYSMRQSFLKGAEMMTGTVPGSIAFGSGLAGDRDSTCELGCELTGQGMETHQAGEVSLNCGLLGRGACPAATWQWYTVEWSMGR